VDEAAVFQISVQEREDRHEGGFGIFGWHQTACVKNFDFAEDVNLYASELWWVRYASCFRPQGCVSLNLRFFVLKGS
jgi:hypothetical protein